ncbi:rrp15-like protein [Anaeramoeba ignava]|uniref:Rrp15-like protein n=1 Tax=Anaeramoeba ignava TaxID=1746090 RepID=A0A9Q0LNM2_ANAIG|nr:rrp15-like protein [Anaeramoeba ignava]
MNKKNKEIEEEKEIETENEFDEIKQIIKEAKQKRRKKKQKKKNFNKKKKQQNSTEKTNQFKTQILQILNEDIKKVDQPILSQNKTSSKKINQIEKQKKEKREEKLFKASQIENKNKQYKLPTNDEYDRKLNRIATIGVVRLFNAIQKQQSIPTENSDLDSKQLSKGKFLEMLKSQDVKVSKNQDQKNIQENSPQNNQKWEVFRDDFLLDAKMKDWDQKNENENENHDSISEESDF